MGSMRKTSLLLLLLLPLGAGLLFLGSPVPEPSIIETTATIDGNGRVPEVLASIDYRPAKTVYLETLVLDGSVGERKTAVRELEAIGTADAVSALSIALGDDDRRVVDAALEALARIGSDEALAAIASLSNDRDPRMRGRAVQALANADGYSSADYLRIALDDDDPRVRAEAVESLGDIGDSRSINIISAALRDDDPEVRARAVEVLDELSDEALFHALFPAQ